MAVFNRQPDLKRITFLKIGTRHAGQVQFRCDCDARYLQRTDHHSTPKIRNQGAGLPPLFKGCAKPCRKRRLVSASTLTPVLNNGYMPWRFRWWVKVWFPLDFLCRSDRKSPANPPLHIARTVDAQSEQSLRSSHSRSCACASTARV